MEKGLRRFNKFVISTGVKRSGEKSGYLSLTNEVH